MKVKNLFCIFVLCLLFLNSSWVSAADLYTLKEIEISGNSKVKETTILNLLPFHVGDQLTKDEFTQKAKEAKEILVTKNIFYNVNIFPFFKEETVECKILVDISGEWTYQLGFDFKPIFGMVEDKAFLGLDNSLGLKVSKYRQEVYFSDRQAFKMPFDLTYSLYNQNKVSSYIYSWNGEKSEILGYYATVGYGGGVALSYKPGKDNIFNLGLKYSEERFGTNLSDSQLDQKLGFYHQDVLTFSAGYKYVSPVLPFDSKYILAINGGVTKVFNTEEQSLEKLLYAKGTTNLTYYQNIFTGLKGAVKLEYGWATANTPYTKLFNLNNLSGVRGEQKICPGNQELLVKGELIFPLIMGVKGVLFSDYGFAWSGDFESANSGWGLGGGLRYTAGMPVNTTFRLEGAFSEAGFKLIFATGESI